MLADFIDSISEKYEMEKFNPEWDRLDESLKADWIRALLKVLRSPILLIMNFP